MHLLQMTAAACAAALPRRGVAGGSIAKSRRGTLMLWCWMEAQEEVVWWLRVVCDEQEQRCVKQEKLHTQPTLWSSA
jgi:hypothetical protein